MTSGLERQLFAPVLRKAIPYAAAGIVTLGSVLLPACSGQPAQPTKPTTSPTTPTTPTTPVVMANPVEEYAKSIGISLDYIPMLKPLDEDKNMENDEKSYVDALKANDEVALKNFYVITKRLADYNMGIIDKANPELAMELRKLPKRDIDFENLMVRDAEVLEDMASVASNPEYKKVFDEILNMGIKDKRQYCPGVQGLVWRARDADFIFDDKNQATNPFMYYSLDKFFRIVWTQTKESNSFKSDRWGFDEGVNRIGISPEMYAVFVKLAMNYEFYFNSKYSVKQVYEGKKGNCVDQSNLAAYVLGNGGGYKISTKKEDFTSYDSDICCTLSVKFDKPLDDGSIGHRVCLYKKDGLFYSIDGSSINGPFKSIDEIGNFITSGKGRKMSSYSLYGP